MRPKEYLHQQGHIDNPNQRGRLSAAHLDIIHQAVQSGVKIDGYAVSDKPQTQDTAPKVERVAPGEGIADIGEPVRPEANWAAHTYINGTRTDVGMREVEVTCGNSLTYCHCRTPYVRVLDSEAPVMVQFSHRSVPYRPKWW